MLPMPPTPTKTCDSSKAIHIRTKVRDIRQICRLHKTRRIQRTTVESGANKASSPAPAEPLVSPTSSRRCTRFCPECAGSMRPFDNYKPLIFLKNNPSFRIVIPVVVGSSPISHPNTPVFPRVHLLTL